MVHPIFKRFASIVLYPYLKKINGVKNIPKDRNFIIAANHGSYVDHFLIASKFLMCLNKRIHFLAKKEHFESWFQKRFHIWADAIPVDRQTGGKEALKWAIDALKDGKIVSIYPEGTRTLDGKLQRGKTGVARVALAAKVPVLPIGLIGTFKMLPKGKYFPRFKRVTVNIGKLMYFDGYYGKENNHEVLRKVTDKTMKEIAKLSNQEYNY